MCGIAGTINYQNNNLFYKLKSTLIHRGPDSQDIFNYKNINFIHTRLSIQDIKHGQQPFKLNEFVIVYNGEIYNHFELRKIYLKDVFFRTTSDTETLLCLYIKYGLKMLDMLDGMFSFAILDKTNNEIVLARDRAGKKPLYYYCDDDKFSFSSELNSLKSINDIEIEDSSIYDYLRQGFFHKSHTPYKKAKELEAGSYAIINISSLEIVTRQWWDISSFYLQKQRDTFDVSKRRVESLLDLSVKRRIESSDLEVGTFLSGGIDSALVTAFASKYTKNLRTFTVSFDGTYDEGPLAKQVSKIYSTNHNEIKIDFKNIKMDLEKIIVGYGEPFFDSSAIPSYYVSEEAKKYLTVILNGDGADELLGGYRRYIPFSKYDFFKSPIYLQKFSQFINNFLRKSHNKQSYYNYLYRLTDFSSKKPLDSYISATSDIFSGYEKSAFVDCNIQNIDLINDMDRINKMNLSGLQKIMLMDFESILFGDLLVKIDISTMSHSLESRSPFLSKELLEYAPTINDKFKINKTTTKYLLREIAKDYLPKNLILQPKRGFEVPLKNWIENDLKDICFDYLQSNNAYSNSFIKKDFINKLLDKKINISDEKRAKIIWTLLVLEIWKKNV